MLPIVVVFSLVSLHCLHNLAQASLSRAEMPRYIEFMEQGDMGKQSEEAVRIWEKAIAAKGGRERIYGVHNMVISMRGEYGSRLLGKNKVRSETLVVLPNKSWNWNDYRPDVFGLRISMYNFETKMKYVISEGEPHRQLEPIPEAEKNRSQMHGLLSDLLETKWSKPVLVGASTGRIGLRSVDIVQTTVNGKRVDFALDQKTHLPVRVSYHDVIKGKTYITAVDLSDYVEISGIKVPQKVKYKDATEYKQSYQFNVRYNEDIFIHPTTIEAGPEAWKAKG